MLPSCLHFNFFHITTTSNISFSPTSKYPFPFLLHFVHVPFFNFSIVPLQLLENQITLWFHVFQILSNMSFLTSHFDSSVSTHLVFFSFVFRFFYLLFPTFWYSLYRYVNLFYHFLDVYLVYKFSFFVPHFCLFHFSSSLLSYLI